MRSKPVEERLDNLLFDLLGFRLDKFTIGVVYQGRRSGRRGSRRPRKRRREVVKETWNILKFVICKLQFDDCDEGHDSDKDRF